MSAFFLAFLIYFIRNEHIDVVEVRSILSSANPVMIAMGLLVTMIYLSLQALLYVYSFKSIGVLIDFRSALVLFLKRNFVSTFLPAGSITSLAFFNDELAGFKLQKGQVYYGSFLFALASLISVVVVSIPVIVFLFMRNNLRTIEFYGVLFLIVLVLLFVYAGYGLVKRRGYAFLFLSKVSPKFVTQLDGLAGLGFHSVRFLQACLISLVIEVTGVIHLYIAISALGLQPSWEVSVIGYAIMVILLMISPFFRGLGAIEISVTYVLTLYGYPTLLAASVTFLFRIFEFWVPFLVSILAFLLNRGNLLLRVFPAVFILFLGVVNILSALTPAIPERMHLLRDFLPLYITEFSNIAVLTSGIVLVIQSAFLLTGAINAWRLALCISAVSLVLHLTKAIDYEEALVALLTIGILLYTKAAYFVKYNITFELRRLQKVMLLVVGLFTYAVAGFYFLRVRHMDFDFTFVDSVVAGARAIFFFTGDLQPKTRAGVFFIYSIQINSLLLMIYCALVLYRASKGSELTERDDLQSAKSLISQYGRSSMDYFKIYRDKQFFFDESKKAFLAYTESMHYAVVLENPVAADQDSSFKLLVAFEEFCFERGLRTFYYRVADEDLPVYQRLKKRSILLGQEAILDLQVFSLEGSARKSMRNAVKKIENAGFHFKVYAPQQDDELLRRIKFVSDDWLDSRSHGEAAFSQGIFLSEEIGKCTVLTVENDQSDMIAFLNIVPSYKPGEATYDLIRQRNDSPNGILDYLTIKMIAFLKESNYKTLNMGMAPMAGLQGTNLNEQIMQFYRDHFKQASRLKGLFDYKNKFDPGWENRYLIYDQAFDLVRFPLVLRAVSRVGQLTGNLESNRKFM